MQTCTKLQEFKSHLTLIKSMSGDKAEEQFYEFMQKVKSTFGVLDLNMGQYYFEYAKFLLDKMEKNIDVFGTKSLPVEKKETEEIPIQEYEDEDDSNIDSQLKGKKTKQQCNQNGVIQHSCTKEQKNNNQQKLDDQPEIKQDGQYKQNEPKNEIDNQADDEQAGEEDDFQVCAQNLLCAIKIFETERNRLQNDGEKGRYTQDQVEQWISRCKSRLGDLYHISQNYIDAVETYRQVIQDEQKKIGHETNRGLAEIHYMIANSFLYENKEGCEKIAIRQLIKSVQIMLNYLGKINPDDTCVYEIPTEDKVKVDRFAYLPNHSNTEEVKEIKAVISCILDKIQDTYEQISVRAQYQAEKKRCKEEQPQNKFNQLSPTSQVTIKLGTFGNRKKLPNDQIPDETLRKRE